MSNYLHYSGDASGADRLWDTLGDPYGIKTIHWRAEHLKSLNQFDREKMLLDIQKAALILGRPWEFKGVELVHRNWLIAKSSHTIYALGYIIAPGKKDYKGYTNETAREVVAGGTGWCVQLGIQMNKQVFVFDMNYNEWFTWFPAFDKFSIMGDQIPHLSNVFAGIGSRYVTEEGEQAIKNIYEKAFSKKEDSSS